MTLTFRWSHALSIRSLSIYTIIALQFSTMRSLFFLLWMVFMTTLISSEVVKADVSITKSEIIPLPKQMNKASNSVYCKLFCSPEQLKTTINEMMIYERIFRDVDEILWHSECMETSPGTMQRYNGKRYFLNKVEELFTLCKHLNPLNAAGQDDAVISTKLYSILYGSIYPEVFKTFNQTTSQLNKCEKCDDRHEVDAVGTEIREREVTKRSIIKSDKVSLAGIFGAVKKESAPRRKMSCHETIAVKRLFRDLTEINWFPGAMSSPANANRYLGNKKYQEQVEWYFQQMTSLFPVAKYFPDAKSNKKAYGIGIRIRHFIEEEETRLGMPHHQRF